MSKEKSSMQKEHKERASNKYQQLLLLSFFIANITLPVIYIIFIKGTQYKYIDLIKSLNLILKALSLSLTVFIPVIVVDATIYNNLDKTDRNMTMLRRLYNSDKKTLWGFSLLSLSMSMFIYAGNIRFWMKELYLEDINLKLITVTEVVCLVLLILFALVGSWLINHSKNSKHKSQ